MSKPAPSSIRALAGLALALVLVSPAAGQGSCPNPDAWFISGTVIDSLGAPLPGANIDLLTQAPVPVSLPLSQDFTLADGSFQLFVCETIPLGSYTLIVTPAPGSPHFSASLSVFLTPPGVALPTPVVLEPGSVLSGVVVDEVGIGIEEVDLEFFDAGGTAVPFSGDVTGPGGAFSVLVTPGTWDVEFRETLASSPAGPYVPRLFEGVPLANDISLGTIVLRDAISLTGTLVGPTGTPLVGGDVDVRDPATGEEILILGGADTTNGAGQFTIPVPSGSWELEIDPPPSVALVAQLVLVDVLPPGPVSVGTVVLPSGFAVSGTTRDAGGLPVPNVDLDFIVSATGIEIATANDNANAQGVFSVLVVPNTYDIQFKPLFATGLAPIEVSSVAVTAPSSLGNVVLPAGNALTGTVTDGGAPVTGALVTLSQGGQPVVVFGNRTDLLGQYALRQVPGTYDVTVTPPPGGGAAVTIPAVDLSQDAVLDVDLAAAAPPPPVSGITCVAAGPEVTLGWQNGASDYDSIEIRRDGALIATVSGSATAYLDPGLADGAYVYDLRPVRGGLTGAAVPCGVVVGSPTELPFVRGDANGDTLVNIADAVGILERLFVSGTPPTTCPDADDANDDGSVNIADAIYVLGYLFSGGASPAAPFPTAGSDPTGDALDCF